MRCLFLSLALAVPACGGDGVVDTVFDPCSPLTIIPAVGTLEHELQTVEDAIVAWSHVLPVSILVGEPSDSEPGLSIRFNSGDTYYRALYMDNTGEILIGRENLDEKDYAVVIAHELGHAFGLLHVSKKERASVMNVGNVELDPTAEDGFAVSALWDSCSPAE